MLKGTKIRRETEKYGYKYKSEPPYTVLRNDFMSYGEILLLSDVAKAYEKYSSPAYKTAFGYIYTKNYRNNIFAILEKIAKYYRSNGLYGRSISQRDSFQAFYDVFKEDGRIKQLLEEAFHRYEKKPLTLSD